METLNFVVSFFAIIVSFIAAVLGYIWAKEAKDSLQETDKTLNKINNLSEQINANVQSRMDELIRRAAPSYEEKVQIDAIGEVFRSVASNPDMFAKVFSMSMKHNKKNK
ncbi:MAG: hypothetical protein ACOX30_07060 [Dethiobacteria bacterium]|jgi:predicted PurR-regulated permease PerM